MLPVKRLYHGESGSEANSDSTGCGAKDAERIHRATETKRMRADALLSYLNLTKNTYSLTPLSRQLREVVLKKKEG